MDTEKYDDYAKAMLKHALIWAEEYAAQTTNPIDDIVVKAASLILKRIFRLED